MNCYNFGPSIRILCYELNLRHMVYCYCDLLSKRNQASSSFFFPFQCRHLQKTPSDATGVDRWPSRFIGASARHLADRSCRRRCAIQATCTALLLLLHRVSGYDSEQFITLLMFILPLPTLPIYTLPFFLCRPIAAYF